MSCIDHGQRGDKDGYGRTTRGGASVRLHRVVLADALGVPVRALQGQANHTCDNSRCVNPAHLYLGTQAENMQDRMAAGHYQHGSANGNAKLTDEDVACIRAEYIKGHRYRPGNSAELAERYGVDRSQILNIARGAQWGRPTK